MPILNIKDIPESKMVKLVDLSEDSINKIAEAVVRKIKVDAVEVVRCEDCKWFEPEDEDGDCWCYCHNDITFRDGYCSWGEKKDDNT